MAKVIQVIEVEITRGKGVEGDVFRGVTQYWALDGTLLAEKDPCAIDEAVMADRKARDLCKQLKPGGSPI